MIKEQEVKFKASEIIDYPGFRQSTKYSCGVATVQSALVYCFGSKYDMPESELFNKLNATESGGVDPDKMMSFLKSKGVNVSSNILTVDDLKENVNKKIPTIICIQAWGKQKDYSKVYKEGHYVTVIGYNNEGFILEDPSISARYGFIDYDDLDERWHDVDKKGNRYDHLGITINCKKKYSPEKMEVVEGKYMKDIVDKYLEEISIQEGHPVLIGMGVLATAIALITGYDAYQTKKAERLLQQNKEKVDRIVMKHLHPLVNMTTKLGLSLYQTITGKYKNLYQYYPEHWKQAVQSLRDKTIYEKKVINSIKKRLIHLIKKDKGQAHEIFFFSLDLEILPGDVLMDNIAREAPESDHDRLDKEYRELSKIINKADVAIKPMFDKIAMEIVKTLSIEIKGNIKENVVHEEGFEMD